MILSPGRPNSRRLLLGKVLATAKPLLLSSRAELAALAPAEPELAAAAGAALLPVRMGEKVLGTLAVWEDDGQVAFEVYRVLMTRQIKSMSDVESSP